MASAGENIFVRGTVDDADSDIWDDTALIQAYDNAVSVMKAKLSESGVPCQEPIKTPDVSKNASKKKKKKNKKKIIKSTPASQWKPGGHCRAVYTEDGEIYEAVIVSLDNAANQCSVRFLGYGNVETQDLVDLLPSVAVKKDSSVAESVSDTQSESDVGIEQMLHQQHRQSRQNTNRRSSLGSSSRGRGRRRMTPPPIAGMPGSLPMNWPEFPPPPFTLPQQQSQWSSPNMFQSFPGVPPFMPPNISSMPRPGAPLPDLHSAPFMPPPPTEDTDCEKDALYSMLISWYMSGYHTGYYKGLKEGKHSSKRTTTQRDQPDNLAEKS